jgi:4,5-DOPA dioxygenase extradiol
VMPALERNLHTAAWPEFGGSMLESFGRPRAILAISAHWYINVTATPQPRTIHDLYGFLAELFDVQYPAPGLPDLAEEIAEVVEPRVGADRDSRGID